MYEDKRSIDYSDKIDWANAFWAFPKQSFSPKEEYIMAATPWEQLQCNALSIYALNPALILNPADKKIIESGKVSSKEVWDKVCEILKEGMPCVEVGEGEKLRKLFVVGTIVRYNDVEWAKVL